MTISGPLTVHETILRELMIAGYEGAPLLAAFGRLAAALVAHGIAAPGALQKPQSAPVAANAVRPGKAAVAPVSITAPPENAKAIARKAIGESMLSPSTIAVGSHLIERFNLKTGRCDPGIGSIAASIGVSRRTVMRAVADLVAAGLFGRARHGGHGHANAYQPNWPVLVERAAEGDIAKVTRLSTDSDNVVTQNHLKKPDSDSSVVRPPAKRKPPHPDFRQRHLPLSFNGGRDAAEAAVRSKLNQQLNDHLKPLGKAVFVDGLERSMLVNWSDAITAEMRKAGDGLPVLLEALASCVPPRQARTW